MYCEEADSLWGTKLPEVLVQRGPGRRVSKHDRFWWFCALAPNSLPPTMLSQIPQKTCISSHPAPSTHFPIFYLFTNCLCCPLCSGFLLCLTTASSYLYLMASFRCRFLPDWSTSTWSFHTSCGHHILPSICLRTKIVIYSSLHHHISESFGKKGKEGERDLP
jgi:hypothetical protein